MTISFSADWVNATCNLPIVVLDLAKSSGVTYSSLRPLSNGFATCGRNALLHALHLCPDVS
jgi:hypothetical protein